VFDDSRLGSAHTRRAFASEIVQLAQGLNTAPVPVMTVEYFDVFNSTAPEQRRITRFELGAIGDWPALKRLSWHGKSVSDARDP
jgi:hypothetical protein